MQERGMRYIEYIDIYLLCMIQTQDIIERFRCETRTYIYMAQIIVCVVNCLGEKCVIPLKA